MEPTIAAGDWLLVDPTTVRWPRRGSVVVFHEPDSGALAIKRVAGGPGDRVPFREGYLELADATAEVTGDAGLGDPIDSRSYGPVPVALLVGRVWFRYFPLRRFGRIRTGTGFKLRDRVYFRVRDDEDRRA